MKRVVIVGMGFGGMEAARHLGNSELEVLILDRHNYHLFQPLLYQVATAELNVEAIAYPIRAIIRRWKNVSFRMAEVMGLDVEKRELLITSEEGDDRVAYDYLILAAGSTTNFFGNAEIMQHAYDLKLLNDAVDLRNQVLSVYERAQVEKDETIRKALMTFVVVGGGPTGVEFSGALSELSHNVLAKDFPGLNVDETKIILVESSEEILSMFPLNLREYALKRLKKMRVDVMLDNRVSGASAGKVMLQSGQEILSHTLVWAAGPLVDQLFLAGGCALIPGLLDIIASRTKISSAVVSPFKGMSLGPAVREQQLRGEAPAYLVACGLALRRFG